MRVNWVFADTYQLDPTISIEHIKAVGPTWGSWRTWRSCGTDNVICHSVDKSKDLIERAFQAVCNFYVPKSFYQILNRPKGLKLYDGDFGHDVDHAEDIVAMHMASAVSDIILLVGFDLTKPKPTDDKFEKHKIQNYHGMIYSLINSNHDLQWVLVDHVDEMDKSYQSLPNLTCDTMANALKLLV